MMDWFAKLAACAALSLIVPIAGAAPFAYATDGDTADGLLYRIDLANNSISSVGNVTGLIEALSFGPGGVLYGIDEDANTLVRINTTTAATSVVGALGMTSEDPGLAFCSDTQQMYAANENGDVFAVNFLTGATTLLGNAGIEISGLACLSGALYAASQELEQLFRVNRANGASTLVGSFGVTITGDLGLASDGTRLLMVDDSGPFYSVSPTTGATTLLATFTQAGLEALAAEGEGTAAARPTQVPVAPLAAYLLLAIGLAAFARAARKR